MLDKGSRPGAHLLSGAVVNPVSFRRLFAGRRTTDDMPFLTRVDSERVYYLTRRRQLRIPTPPPMRNHGNYVASISQLGRWLAERGGGARRRRPSRDDREKLLVSHGRVTGVRTATAGAGATASSCRGSRRARRSRRR